MLIAMTGGAHDNYLTFGVFDRSKWDGRMDGFNSSAIKSAVAGAVADGTIIGNVVMDEPNVSGSGDGNTWGPPGTMTKARVDSLCGYVKELFPTLPAGVQHRHDIFEPTKGYRVCDFVASQYSSRVRRRDLVPRFGLWRWRGVTATRSCSAMNILNGGEQDKDGVYDCTGPGPGRQRHVRPQLPDDARSRCGEWGQTLGPVGCAMFMSGAMTRLHGRTRRTSRRSGTSAARLATAPAKSCRQPVGAQGSNV